MTCKEIIKTYVGVNERGRELFNENPCNTEMVKKGETQNLKLDKDWNISWVELLEIYQCPSCRNIEYFKEIINKYGN